MLPRRSSSPLYRAAACVVRGAATDTAPERVAKDLYAGDDNVPLLLRAASHPATISNVAWGGIAAHDVIASELIQRLTALSAAANLMQAGMRIDFARRASITIPGRSFNPQSAGAWISEGSAIPFRQPPILAGPKLEPKKIAVLCSFTSEMALADSIEEFVTAAIREAAGALLDEEMFSTNTPSAAAPGGILAGATSVPPSGATAVWAISSDIGALVDALAPAGGGLEPMIVAAPSQAASLRMWRQQNYYPIFASLALAAGTVVAVESSSFVSGLDGVPEFSTSIGATLHYEDSVPVDIAGPSGTLAVPVRSLFQDDLIGLRMVLRATWGMRNPAHVAVMSGVSW
jgi:HK97 family phage major capsid protein